MSKREVTEAPTKSAGSDHTGFARRDFLLAGSSLLSASAMAAIPSLAEANGISSAVASAIATQSASAFPDASTTGVPAGTVLTVVNGDFTSSSNGQIIDGLNVNGTIIINDDGVTERNCHSGLIVITPADRTVRDCT